MISRETIARVRERADIAAVVGETVKLVRRGRHLIGLCPFHKEKTPSFHVNPEHGRYYCFGCHEHGTAIDFVMKVEGLDFPSAVRQLAERFGLQLEEQESAEQVASRAAHRAQQELYEALNLAASYFEAQLREHPHASFAKEELQRRALVPQTPTDMIADALQAFRVGYAPHSWDALTYYLHSQGVSPRVAEAAGLIVPRKGNNGHYDFFRHRLMFAILDVQGRVVGFSGRVLPEPDTGQVPPNTGKYINSPESGVYKKGQTVFGLFQARQAIRRSEKAVLVEGNFDVVALHARGVRHVVAPLGTAFTAPQAKLVKRFAPQIVLLFDADNAGKEAVKKARPICQEAGLEARVATLPSGKDPDEFIRDNGAEALERVLAAAQPLLESLIASELDKDFAQRSAREQVARINEVLTLLAAEDDPTVRAMAKGYADKLAARLAIADSTTLRTLEAAVRRALVPKSPGQERPVDLQKMAPTRARSSIIEGQVPLDMLGCVIDCPVILDDPQVQEALGVLEGEIALAVALARNLVDSDGGESADTFLAHLPAPIHDFAAQRLACPKHEDAGEARIEFLHNAQKLRRRGLSREHALVIEEISDAQAKGDADQEEALLLEAVRKHRERIGI